MKASAVVACKESSWVVYRVVQCRLLYGLLEFYTAEVLSTGSRRGGDECLTDFDVNWKGRCVVYIPQRVG